MLFDSNTSFVYSFPSCPPSSPSPFPHFKGIMTACATAKGRHEEKIIKNRAQKKRKKGETDKQTAR